MDGEQGNGDRRGARGLRGGLAAGAGGCTGDARRNETGSFFARPS